MHWRDALVLVTVPISHSPLALMTYFYTCVWCNGHLGLTVITHTSKYQRDKLALHCCLPHDQKGHNRGYFLSMPSSAGHLLPWQQSLTLTHKGVAMAALYKFSMAWSLNAPQMQTIGSISGQMAGNWDSQIPGTTTDMYLWKSLCG